MSNLPRRIYFLRHGLADRSAYTGSDDRLRPLTAAGIARLEAAALKLAALDLGCDLILSSPLTRCRQTAEIVAPALGLADVVKTTPELAPGFDLADLRPLLAAQGPCDAVLLVGHEPDFSDIVSRLTGGSELVFKKGGLARVDLHCGRAELWGDLVWLLPPKVLAL